jgi:heat-inducible transcriptional repressor
MLAQLTRQVAIVQYPSLTRSTVRHVELVQMPPTRMLLVLITSTGRVEQRVVDVGEEASAELLADLRARINAACIGERIVDAVTKIADLAELFEPGDRPLVSVVTTALMEAFTDHRSEERIVVGGTANLTRFGDDFDHSIRPMLEALEEHVVLMQLLGQATGGSTLTVRIGSEVPHQDLSRTAIVASGYGSDAMDPLGTLGVVGTDQDGLPRNDGVGTCCRPLRQPAPGRRLTCVPLASPPHGTGRHEPGLLRNSRRLAQRDAG